MIHNLILLMFHFLVFYINLIVFIIFFSSFPYIPGVLKGECFIDIINRIFSWSFYYNSVYGAFNNKDE